MFLPMFYDNNSIIYPDFKTKNKDLYPDFVTNIVDLYPDFVTNDYIYNQISKIYDTAKIIRLFENMG